MTPVVARHVAGRARAAAAAVVLAGVGLCGVSLDASHRRATRAAEQRVIDDVAMHLPSADLALSGGARWLRAPSLEEPGAAFAEGPAMPDPDPAGGIMAPPREAWALEPARDGSGTLRVIRHAVTRGAL